MVAVALAVKRRKPVAPAPARPEACRAATSPVTAAALRLALVRPRVAPERPSFALSGKTAARPACSTNAMKMLVRAKATTLARMPCHHSAPAFAVGASLSLIARLRSWGRSALPVASSWRATIRTARRPVTRTELASRTTGRDRNARPGARRFFRDGGALTRRNVRSRAQVAAQLRAMVSRFTDREIGRLLSLGFHLSRREDADLVSGTPRCCRP